MHNATKLKSVVAGAALGDAWGADLRELTLRQIKAKFGPQGLIAFPTVSSHGPHTADILRLFRAGTGSTVQGVNPAACVAGLAARLHGDDGALFVALERCVPDFAMDRDTVAATVGAGYLVAVTLQGVHVTEYINKVMTFCDGLSDAFDAALLRIGHVLGWVDEDAALKHIGKGKTPVETVAMALYCVLRYDDDFVSCVRRAAHTDGDSAAIAAIAGGVMGARLGDSALLPKNGLALGL